MQSNTGLAPGVTPGTSTEGGASGLAKVGLIAGGSALLGSGLLGNAFSGGSGIDNLVGNAGTDTLAGVGTGALPGTELAANATADPLGSLIGQNAANWGLDPATAAMAGGGAAVGAGLGATTATSGGVDTTGGALASPYGTATGAGATAATSAPGALSRVMDGTATAADYLALGLPLAGAALGAVGANSKPAGTTTTVQDLPEWLKPYVQSNLNAAQASMTANPQNNSLLGPATDQLKSTIQGDYLNSNPYLDKTFQMAANPVVANINSQFSKAGRYGSGAQAATLGTTLDNLSTQIYGGNYATERGRQQAAAIAAPGFTTDTTTAQFAPFNAFGNLTKGLGVNSTTSPYFSNPVGGALSGALAGYGLSQAFK